MGNQRRTGEAVAPGPGERVMTNDGNGGDDRVYPSLQQALTAREIPVENHALIRRICEHLGINRFEERVGYIKAVRPDDGPALEIHYGYTNGFRSEREARDAVGDERSPWASERGTGQWGVTHPTHAMREANSPLTKSNETYRLCPIHHLALPASGICDYCP